ncbi:MAG: hypothetical protein ABIR28_06495 [Vicinamibacteria bacterium]
MAQPSSLQILGGPLKGRRFEFRGIEGLIGSGPECNVRIEADGVEGQHAKIVVEISGATIYRVDGIVGVNDDVILGDGLLRSGDFVWIGEPGGSTSLMLQFTLGDVGGSANAIPTAAAWTAEPEVRESVSPSGELFHEEVQADDFASNDQMEMVEEVEEAPEPEPVAVEQEEVLEEVAAVEMAESVEAHEFEPAADVEAPVFADEEEPVLVEPHEEPLFAEFEAPVDHESPLDPVDYESPFDDDMQPTPPPVETPKTVPPAPWQMASSLSEPAAPAEYASAWESAPAKPAEPVEPESAEAVPPPPPPPARPAPPTSGSMKRPPATSPKMKIRTVEQDAALRTPPPPPPPARTTSSTPFVLGGLGMLVVLAIAGFFLLRPSAPAPTPMPPTPVATPVTLATSEATAHPEATPESTPVAVVEATPAPPVAAPVPPTPRAATTPPPRVTPTPRSTPTPKATPTPVNRTVAPAPAPTVAAPTSQVPRVLEEARAAMAARDLPRASQLLDQALRLEPGNGEATTRKAEVDSRIAALNRKFGVGATTVLGGKTAKKGPTGFDLGGGGIVQTDFSAQIRCSTTPASLENGMPYSVRCNILNIGTKAFRILSVAGNETLDGAKTSATGTAPGRDIAPQSDGVIFEKSGTWTAKSQWSLELVAKTTKDESFRAVFNWR